MSIIGLYLQIGRGNEYVTVVECILSRAHRPTSTDVAQRHRIFFPLSIRQCECESGIICITYGQDLSLTLRLDV